MVDASSRPNIDVPDPSEWSSPLSWGGIPLRALPTGALEFPATASFVRAALLYTLERSTGPGMTSQSQQGAHGLLRLDKGRAVEVHTPGLDGRCWTFRLAGKGRAARWTLCTGDGYPAHEEFDQALMGAQGIESVVVQSLLPGAQSRKHVSFRIWGDGRMEDFSKLSERDAD